MTMKDQNVLTFTAYLHVKNSNFEGIDIWKYSSKVRLTYQSFDDVKILIGCEGSTKLKSFFKNGNLGNSCYEGYEFFLE